MVVPATQEESILCKHKDGFSAVAIRATTLVVLASVAIGSAWLHQAVSILHHICPNVVLEGSARLATVHHSGQAPICALRGSCREGASLRGLLAVTTTTVATWVIAALYLRHGVEFSRAFHPTDAEDGGVVATLQAHTLVETVFAELDQVISSFSHWTTLCRM